MFDSFFFNDTATTEIYTLSLHDALPISGLRNQNDHDILGFLDTKSDSYIIIDPTIWQFFPKKKSILLGKFKTQKEFINFLPAYYGGDWQLSEYIDESMKKDVSGWKEIIKENYRNNDEKRKKDNTI